METAAQHQAKFWQALGTAIADGDPLLTAVTRTGAKFCGDPLERIASQIAEDLRAGRGLAEALERQATVFPRAARVMVRAGEAGSGLDKILPAIAAGIEDGTIQVPGAGGRAATPLPAATAAALRLLGRLIGAAVPILEAVDVVAEEHAGTDLARAMGVIREAILHGRNIGQQMRDLSAIFDPRVAAAVARAEDAGRLDYELPHIADALEAGDLGPIESVQGEVGGGEAEAAQIVEYIMSMVRDAVRARSSDIHVDACEDGSGQVRFRVDGVLQQRQAIPADRYAAVRCRMKLMAGMDVAENRLPQDGRIMLDLEGERYDLRMSSCPALWGERVVCRILARQNIQLDIERMGFSPADLATVRRLAKLPYGLVIVNGPTGCGKTTILYSMIMTIDRRSHCVVSVEDPVEVALDGVAQIQIQPAIGRTFARCIRSVFRQDPDVILVGELRDLEMMTLCVQAAMTGHLVMTTLHAQTSVGAIRRLVDCGLEPFMVNSTVEGVITPRLVRGLCPKCRRPASPAAHSLPAEAARIIAGLEAPTFFEPVGCPECAGTGYRGRTTVNEVLVPNDRFRDLVSKPLDMPALHAAAVAAGMKPMLADGLEKAARGVTSIQEVLRTVPPAAEWR